MICEFEQCDREVIAKGLCPTHYQQQRRGGPLKPIRVPVDRPNETYCRTCQTQKTREDFYLRVDGRLQSECSLCMRTRSNAKRREAQRAVKLVRELKITLEDG
jgi:hypothetical protein